MSELEKYIYGVINSNTESSFEDISFISYRDISAVISDSQFIDYTTLGKNQLGRSLLSHQKVLEKIMDTHTIIPMRLGTFAHTNEEVREILYKGYNTIKIILERVKNSMELEVAANWSDFNSVLKQVSEEKEINEFKQTLLNKKEGISIDDQIKIGAMVKNHVHGKREKYAREIQLSLSKVSEEVKVHELMDDKMVINISFLINETNQKDFDKILEELNKIFAELLHFRCVGPLPPYSFYILEVKKMKFEKIECARKKLGLNNVATRDVIKKAYKQLAFSLHPDKNPDSNGMEGEFDNLTNAYRILTEYCLAVEQADQVDSYSFNEEEVKRNAILVSVRQ